MAFSWKGFRTLDFMFNPSGLPGANLGTHAYVTNDDRATIEAAGYFNSLAKVAKVGDHIDLTFALSTAPARRAYIVAAIAAGVVSIAAQDQGGGLTPYIIRPLSVDAAGDSLTFGTGSTGSFNWPFIFKSIAGSANILAITNNGVGGQKLAAIAAAMISRIASFDVGVLEGGTNDCDTGTPLQTSTDAIVSVANAYKAAKKKLFYVVPPPYYTGTNDFNVPAYQQAVKDLRAWAIANAATYGFVVIDWWASVVDTDGQLKPAYRMPLNDGVHVNTECYTVLAKLLRVAFAAAGLLGVNAVRDKPLLNLCSNPGNAGAGAVPTGAAIAYQGGSGTGWVKSYVNDTDSILVPGNKWFRIAADATAADGYLQIGFAGASMPTGEIGSYRAKIRLTDANGTTIPQLRGVAGYVDFGVAKGGIIQGGEFYSDNPVPYESDTRYTATSTAVHVPFLIVNLKAGQNITVDIGDIGMFDMTANPF